MSHLVTAMAITTMPITGTVGPIVTTWQPTALLMLTCITDGVTTISITTKLKELLAPAAVNPQPLGWIGTDDRLYLGGDPFREQSGIGCIIAGGNEFRSRPYRHFKARRTSLAPVAGD